MINLTDSIAFTTPVQVGADGDSENQASFALHPQALANRTAYLKNESETTGVLALRFGTLAAMQGLTGMATGQCFWVQSTGATGTSGGVYTYNAASTATADGTLVVSASGGAGRWMQQLAGLANTVPGYPAMMSGTPTAGALLRVATTSPLTFAFAGSSAAVVWHARGVVTANVASLASFTVAGNDGITYVAGDLVLLVNQTAGAQNGLYTVGTVTTGTAPLTLAAGWASGNVVPECPVHVSEGTTWAHSTWRIATQGAITVGTTSIAFYPRIVRGSLTNSGTAQTIANVWVLAGATVLLTPSGTQSYGSALPTAGAGNGSFLIYCNTTGVVFQYSVQNFS